MSETGATPGPWEFQSPANYIEGRGVSIQAADDESVLFVDMDGELNCSEANARLIASAPDLLAALERISEPDPDDTVENLAYLAAQAIAKARGGSEP